MTPPDSADGAGLPDIAAIEQAAARLRPHAVATPLLDVSALARRAGRRVLVKAEALQRTGSFKFRGAYNRIATIPEGDRAKGVVAFSSGNHAQGVAAAAAIFGIPATIVMPQDAPAVKRRNTEALGARIIPYRRGEEDREAIAEAIIAGSGATLIRPYDDAGVIAGQGTVGLEMAQHCAALDLRPDAVLVCCGGGGLSAGIATALADRLPGVVVHPVEPVGYDDTGRSLAAGRRLGNPPGPLSICDGLMAATPGALTFEINRHRLGRGFAVTEDAVRGAMRVAFEDLKLVLEPSGAAALAAALDPSVLPEAEVILCVATGGNVDRDLYLRLLAD